MLLVRQLSSICRTGNEIPIYKKYTCNSDQSDFDLFANHAYIKIVIILAIDINFLGHQYDVVVQMAGHSLEQLFCYGDISFGHVLSPNCETLVFLSNKFV